MGREDQHDTLVGVGVEGQFHVHYEVAALALVEQHLSDHIPLLVVDLVLLLEALVVAAYHLHHEPRHVTRPQHVTTHTAASGCPQFSKGFAVNTGHDDLIFVADRSATLPDTLGGAEALPIDHEGSVVGVGGGS